MDTIYTNLTPIIGLKDQLKPILFQKYNLTELLVQQSLHTLDKTINELDPALYVYIEHPYVDKTYRDSYYNYYASKRDRFERNTIKLSFFNGEICEQDFRTLEGVEKLQNLFQGFVVLRPTFPYIIGRSVLTTTALNRTTVITSKVKYETTTNGVKLNINGFPHSSQDRETITCAETTVWSLLEYFGNKYPEYKPALPTQINKVLGKYSVERLVPSKGLTAGQVAYALKEFGFGVKLYALAAYGEEFMSLAKIYVESGIPVVGLIQNKNIGHALSIIGREHVTEEAIAKLEPSYQWENNLKIYEFEKLDLNYCMVDDNYPPYQMAKLESPASYYEDKAWGGCIITNLIIPLYPKIYLEAGEARTTSLRIIKELTQAKDKDIIVKTFLASGRSYKNEIAINEDLNADIKELLLSSVMPKFIWVTEISDKTIIRDGLISGLVILDATEPNRPGLLAAIIDNAYIVSDLAKFTKLDIPLQKFKGYTNNLN